MSIAVRIAMRRFAGPGHSNPFCEEAPLIIWIDPVELPWNEEERASLAIEPEGRVLLEPFPAGVHGRPAGGDSVLIYWTYDSAPAEPVFPITWDPAVPEIFLRGMSVMVPSFQTYFRRLPKPYVDGGYYAKTEENRPLVGPTPVHGAYLMGAFSGYDIMAACAAGELLAAYVTGTELPIYASALTLERYQDPDYQSLLADWSSSGQL